MNIKSQIPNIITLLNLFCGCIALVFVSKLNFEMAFYFVCLGIFFDFFDGFFARLFKVSSPLGLQLDSLADMITSGVVPGFVLFQMLASLHTGNEILPYIGFLVTIGACYRLANFNIDTRQTDSFIGLPTPANALFVISLPLISENFIHFNVPILISIVIASTLVMNAEIPLFSLKVKTFDLKKNLVPVFFLVAAVFLISIFRFLGVALVILMYVLFSAGLNFFRKK